MKDRKSNNSDSKNCKRVIRVDVPPVITETGAVARMATLADGTFQAQTYIRAKGWESDVVSAYSVMIAFEGANEKKLAARRYSKEQIAEILEQPEPEHDPTSRFPV